MAWRDSCRIEGCNNIVGKKGARGWCNKHYLRWWYTDDPLGSKRPTPGQRFWKRVEPTGFCWEWTGDLDQNGYGLFGSYNTTYRAHRWAYEYLVGEIPEGLQIDHLCRNRACVNPDHMEPVTFDENFRRGLACRVQNGMVNHCPQGHEYSVENTYLRPGGYKVCRKCMAGHRKRYQDKKKREAA